MVTIGYIDQIFPSLTKTFVYREIFALRKTGLCIETFSTWRPKSDELSHEAKFLIEDTFYIFPLNVFRFLWNHVQYLITRPKRYLGTILFCLAGTNKGFKNKLRILIHFCEAVHLAKEVHRRKVRHLHAHFASNATTLVLVVSRLIGITFSFTAHANDIFANPVLLPQKIKAAQFIIAISEYNRKFLYSLVPHEDTLDKIHLVHCGIDVQKFSPPDRRVMSDQLTILAIGRLVEKKGFLYLIKACKILRDWDINFRCLIIGGGPQEAILKQMVMGMDLSDYVSIVGVVFQEHLRDYLVRTDIFVLPCVVASDGDMDGIPNSLMEAMAMEIATISTDVSGIPELIENMNTGLLVTPQDEISLAKAIAKLLENEDLRKTLGKNGRKRVVAEFEMHASAKCLVGIYQSYLMD